MHTKSTIGDKTAKRREADIFSKNRDSAFSLDSTEKALGQLAAPVPQVARNILQVPISFLPPGCGETAMTTPSTHCLTESTAISNGEALRVEINGVDKGFPKWISDAHTSDL
jgi:hypothetical protein